ncbi:hypothetical protein [Desertimonas flava]|uniref:hypothetical protein n=1 Tax=Desertimonas flava TaxID=2064846 RepID=UPI000E3486DB|nr:hypothetical protein [Desertimonas flava]
MTFTVWLRDTAERAISTIVQAAIVFVIAAGAVLDDAEWWKGLVAALIPGAFNVIKQAFESWIPTPTSWAADMAVRAFWTFVITLAGAATAAGFELFSTSAWQTIALVALTAALAIAKAGLAARWATDETARLTPASFAKAA